VGAEAFRGFRLDASIGDLEEGEEEEEEEMVEQGTDNEKGNDIDTPQRIRGLRVACG
jgi:hypothetical protein